MKEDDVMYSIKRSKLQKRRMIVRMELRKRKLNTKQLSYHVQHRKQKAVRKEERIINFNLTEIQYLCS